jgi:IS5 family transposase
MMVYFRKWLPESVSNDCNERIVRHGLSKIQSAQSDNDSDVGHASGTDEGHGKRTETPRSSANQGSLLIDSTCIPADIRHPLDLSLLNEDREVTEKLIDAMHPQVREAFCHKSRTHRNIARK